MRNKFHGLFSLTLFATATVVALIALSIHSIQLTVLYLVVIGLSFTGVLYAYCSKCIVRSENCSHVLPGKLTRLLPDRKQGPYTFKDIGGTAAGLAAIVLFPQYWLIQNKPAFIIFWFLVVVAVAEILTRVCRQCQNTRCLMCPNKRGEKS